MERLLIVGLGMGGQLAAATAVVAAKSIIRFPEINKQHARANKLVGAARYKAYGGLDLTITKQYAPWAAYDNRNSREFTSARVGGYLFQPANASADLNTLFVK